MELAPCVPAEVSPEKHKMPEEEEEVWSEDEIDEADWNNYMTQGFDIDDFALTIAKVAFAIIVPLRDLKKQSQLMQESIISHSKDAIEMFNNLRGKKFEFVDVVKANMEGVAGIIFYITFTAKDADSKVETFQTKVFDGIPKKDGTPHVEVIVDEALAIKDQQDEHTFRRVEPTAECQASFEALKNYLIVSPFLSKPLVREELFLYLAIAESAVSAVLVREQDGNQLPIYYVSKVLQGDELCYPDTEKLVFALLVAARKLQPYFQSHSITVLTDNNGSGCHDNNNLVVVAVIAVMIDGYGDNNDACGRDNSGGHRHDNSNLMMKSHMSSFCSKALPKEPICHPFGTQKEELLQSKAAEIKDAETAASAKNLTLTRQPPSPMQKQPSNEDANACCEDIPTLCSLLSDQDAAIPGLKDQTAKAMPTLPMANPLSPSQVCPTLGAPLIKRVVNNFVPDEFCPSPIPDDVLEALDSEDALEAAEEFITSFPCIATPTTYSPPLAASLADIIGELGSQALLRSGSSVSLLRIAYTSDDELDELDSPLTSIITGNFRVSPNLRRPKWTPKQKGRPNVVRYRLLREVWIDGE
ncbi:hypothetical protein RJ639_042562 [Escallonia herrerae]|uniref:Reverse transcriptase/retrotransposon-derived protein RNase H-like domain-containing protein n=1 Tax=Escallonia herrerae TaxID=1293975 RepID=A0AA89B379_9ASTE|nr:hypothetical protein RJ639_042562 [Escallonia herrerae]